MSVLLRTRVASFLSGVAVTGVFAVYELRRDLAEGQALLVKQVDSHAKTMEERVTRLEGVVAQMHQAQAGA